MAQINFSDRRIRPRQTTRSPAQAERKDELYSALDEDRHLEDRRLTCEISPGGFRLCRVGFRIGLQVAVESVQFDPEADSEGLSACAVHPVWVLGSESGDPGLGYRRTRF